mgnify:CR=1 FL=1
MKKSDTSVHTGVKRGIILSAWTSKIVKIKLLSGIASRYKYQQVHSLMIMENVLALMSTFEGYFSGGVTVTWNIKG